MILIDGDLRDADGILGHPELRELIDFSRPAALCLTLLLHFVRDEEDPHGSFFSGLDMVEPGIVFLSQWRPVTEYYAGGGTRWAYAGVGRKP